MHWIFNINVHIDYPSSKTCFFLRGLLGVNRNVKRKIKKYNRKKNPRCLVKRLNLLTGEPQGFLQFEGLGQEQMDGVVW